MKAFIFICRLLFDIDILKQYDFKNLLAISIVNSDSFYIYTRSQNVLLVYLFMFVCVAMCQGDEFIVFILDVGTIGFSQPTINWYSFYFSNRFQELLLALNSRPLNQWLQVVVPKEVQVLYCFSFM